MKNCILCGKEIIAYRNNKRFCDECAKMKDRERSHHKRVKNTIQQNAAKSAQNRKGLIDDAKAAKAVGMSYGQWRAMITYNKLK